MKISILSDFHFGYAWNSRLEEDSFQNAKEAISKSLGSDLIIIAGDIFDTRIPNTEMWAKALRTLSKPLLSKNTGIKLVRPIGKNLEEVSQRTLKGIPILALHGTHERRGRDQVNAIQALEQTGFLIHLHCNGLIFEKDNQKVAIQGMSGVPERYAKDILDKWNPQPIEDCYNILLLHQSIEPYVYSPLEPPTLNLSNLPEGFDLIIAGHIHTPELTNIGETTLLMPGSTIVTQQKKEESKAEKGFHQLFLQEKKIEFVKLENARKFIFREITLDDQEITTEQIEDEIKDILKTDYKKKPLVKLKITSKEAIDRELREIENKYTDRMILNFSTQVESSEIQEKLELLQKMRDERISIEEMGIKLLNENLQELNFHRLFDAEELLRLLADGRTKTAFNILTGEQKTLKQIS